MIRGVQYYNKHGDSIYQFPSVKDSTDVEDTDQEDLVPFIISHSVLCQPLFIGSAT